MPYFSGYCGLPKNSTTLKIHCIFKTKININSMLAILRKYTRKHIGIQCICKIRVSDVEHHNYTKK